MRGLWNCFILTAGRRKSGWADAFRRPFAPRAINPSLPLFASSFRPGKIAFYGLFVNTACKGVPARAASIHSAHLFNYFE
jgi:hypothetical protein